MLGRVFFKFTTIFVSLLMLSLLLGSSSCSLFVPSPQLRCTQTAAKVLETKVLNFSFCEPVLVNDELHPGYVRVIMDGCTKFSSNIGEPKLPVKIFSFKLPPTALVRKVEFSGSSAQKSVGSEIVPAQHPPFASRFLETKDLSEKFEKNEQVYASAGPLPEKWLHYSHTFGRDTQSGRFASWLTLALNPVRYFPAQNEIEYLQTATVRISYELHPATLPPSPPRYDMLIIAPRMFNSTMQSLVTHKNSYGVKTLLVDLEDVYASAWSSPAADNPEKIKRYIFNAENNWGFTHVLLGGDTPTVPHRLVYLPDWFDDSGGYGIDGTDVPSDLYFADIYKPGGQFCSWNDNGNARWGEQNGDGVDGNPDIYVGRLPASSSGELQNMINHIINYAQNAYEQPWFRRAVFVGTDTFTNSARGIPESEYGNDYIRDNYMSGFTNIFLSETNTYPPIDGSAVTSQIASYVNQGCGFLHFSDHGMYDGVIYLGGSNRPQWSSNDAAQMTNGDKLPVATGAACLSAGFDNQFHSDDCFGEHMLLAPNGGAICYTGYTRVAFGGEDQNWIQYYAGYMQIRWQKAYYDAPDNITTGKMWASAEQDYLTHMNQNDVYDHKMIRAFVLLGDPSVKVGGYPPRPVATLSNPNGGETWYNSTVHTISWNITGGFAPYVVNLTLSTDGGLSYPTRIVTGAVQNAAGPGSYSWTVPSGISARCRIKIELCDSKGYGSKDVSDANFTILHRLLVRLSSPKGGDGWYAGGTYNITWSYIGGIGNHTIGLEYSTTGISGPYNLIVQRLRNLNTYRWQVPGLKSNDCFIRVTVSDEGSVQQTVSDTSGQFGIGLPPTITLRSPNGGEILYGNENTDIRWTAAEGIGTLKVKLEYSVTGNSGTFVLIAQDLPNTGIYSWLVPNIASSHCVVRATVSDAGSAQVSDVSDDKFIVAKKLEIFVLTPAGGDMLYASENSTIRWNATGGYGILGIDLEYSTSGPAGPYTSIDENVSNTGSYIWEVPNTPSTNCYLRVTVRDANSRTAAAVSGSAFTIVRPLVIVMNAIRKNACLYVGENVALSWSSWGGYGRLSVKLEYSTNGASGMYRMLRDMLASNGTWDWKVPDEPSRHCWLKATVTDGNGHAVSVMNGEFMIAQYPKVELLSPDGGEVWVAGSTQLISWLGTGGPPGAQLRIDLYYSLDGGNTFQSIAKSLCNVTIYGWSVPFINSTNVKIKVTVTDINGKSSMDMSRAAFTIRTPSPGTGMISGRVETLGNEPLAAAELEIFAAGSATTVVSTAYTITDGTYRAPGLQPARYDVRASKPGYITASIEGSIVMAGVETVLDFVLYPLGATKGTIYGFVVDRFSSAPVANATVTLYLAGTTEPLFRAMSSCSGYYSFHNLTPGTYDIRVAKSGYLNGEAIGKEVSAGAYTKVSFELSREVSVAQTGDGTIAGLSLIVLFLLLIAIIIVCAVAAMKWKKKKIPAYYAQVPSEASYSYIPVAQQLAHGAPDYLQSLQPEQPIYYYVPPSRPLPYAQFIQQLQSPSIPCKHCGASNPAWAVRCENCNRRIA